MKSADKSFYSVISYLKFISIAIIIMSISGMIFLNIAPFFTLEQLIFSDIYGSPQLPDDAKPAFNFAYLLFDLASVILGVFQFGIAKHVIAKKEKWGYQYYSLGAYIWVIGASIIAFYTGATSYLLSAGMMGILMLPPVFLLKKYFY